VHHLAYKKQPYLNESPREYCTIEKIDQLGITSLKGLNQQRRRVEFWVVVLWEKEGEKMNGEV